MSPGPGQAGISPQHRRGPHREREVLTLVAAGPTNAEIGRALFISVKTASVHVSDVMGKLGVSRRGAARSGSGAFDAVSDGGVNFGQGYVTVTYGTADFPSFTGTRPTARPGSLTPTSRSSSGSCDVRGSG